MGVVAILHTFRNLAHLSVSAGPRRAGVRRRRASVSTSTIDNRDALRPRGASTRAAATPRATVRRARRSGAASACSRSPATRRGWLRAAARHRRDALSGRPASAPGATCSPTRVRSSTRAPTSRRCRRRPSMPDRGRRGASPASAATTSPALRPYQPATRRGTSPGRRRRAAAMLLTKVFTGRGAARVVARLERAARGARRRGAALAPDALGARSPRKRTSRTGCACPGASSGPPSARATATPASRRSRCSSSRSMNANGPRSRLPAARARPRGHGARGRAARAAAAVVGRRCIAAAMLAWRAWAAWRNERLPRRWLLCCSSSVGVGRRLPHLPHHLRPRCRRDAARAVPVAEAARDAAPRRDVVVVTFLCYFLALTNFFYSQTHADRRADARHGAGRSPPRWSPCNGPRAPAARERPRRRRCCSLQGVPVMLVLFFLFPRVPGPALGPADGRVRRHDRPVGLDDAGQHLSLLSQSDADRLPRQVRRRRRPTAGASTGAARCSGTSTAAPGAPGEVRLSGARRIRAARRAAPLRGHARAARAQLAVRARPARPGAAARAGATGDFQLLSRRRCATRMRYEMSSFLEYRAMGGATPDELAAARQLPPGFNPRAVALARELAARVGDRRPHRDARGRRTSARARLRVHARAAAARRATRSTSSCSQTRSGFCEHFASAFVVPDARRRRAGARRHRLPGRRGQPGRRLSDRAPVRRARLGRGLARRRGLGARRPDRGGGPDRASSRGSPRRCRPTTRCRCSGGRT